MDLLAFTLNITSANNFAQLITLIFLLGLVGMESETISSSICDFSIRS